MIANKDRSDTSAMKILTAAQMQRIDRLTTERYGVPSLTLMENAGHGVVEFLARQYGPLQKHRIAVLCGRGSFNPIEVFSTVARRCILKLSSNDLRDSFSKFDLRCWHS